MKLVNDTHAKHFSSLTDSVGKECERNVNFEIRLIFCLDRGLIPFLRRKKSTNKADAYTAEVIILHDIVTEMKRQRIDISSLPQLQSMIVTKLTIKCLWRDYVCLFSILSLYLLVNYIIQPVNSKSSYSVYRGRFLLTFCHSFSTKS
jgi:hypothetical protein